MFPLPFLFFFFQVTMSQDRIVMCFHEYGMEKKKKKEYKVLALYIIAIVAKCKHHDYKLKLWQTHAK